MAVQVKMPKNREFQFKSGVGAQSKYPWDEWFTGQLLLLEKDTSTEKKDFAVEAISMPGKIKSAARRRFKICQVSFKDADGNKLVDSLIIRARDMMADERQAEEERRAEAKAARTAAGEPESNGEAESA